MTQKVEFLVPCGRDPATRSVRPGRSGTSFRAGFCHGAHAIIGTSTRQGSDVPDRICGAVRRQTRDFVPVLIAAFIAAPVIARDVLRSLTRRNRHRRQLRRAREPVVQCLMFRCVVILALASAPAGARQITGQIVGANGASTSPRFAVFGSVQVVGQARSSSVQFSIAPLTPTQRDSIFANGFE